MIVFVLFLVAVFSVLLAFSEQYIVKKFNITSGIMYIVVGIFFAAFLRNVFPDVLKVISDSLNTYSITVALIVLFIISGISINFQNLQKSGRFTMRLSTLPVHIDGIISGLFFFLIAGLWMMDFTLVETTLIMIIFAYGSASIAVPITMKHTGNQVVSEKNINDSAVVATIFDNFTILPITIVPLIIIAVGNSGTAGAQKGFWAIVISIVFILLLMIIGFVVGKVVGLLTKQLQLKTVLYLVVVVISGILLINIFAIMDLFIENALVKTFKGIIASFAILVAFGYGIGINTTIDNENRPQISRKGTMGILLFCNPIILLYIGMQTELTMFLDLKLISLMTVLVIFSVLVKSLVTYLMLKRNEYNTGEIKYMMLAFLPKGKAMINLVIAFSPVLLAAGADNVVEFMTYFGIFGVLVTVPLTLYINSSKGENYILNE